MVQVVFNCLCIRKENITSCFYILFLACEDFSNCSVVDVNLARSRQVLVFEQDGDAAALPPPVGGWRLLVFMELLPVLMWKKDLGTPQNDILPHFETD